MSFRMILSFISRPVARQPAVTDASNRPPADRHDRQTFSGQLDDAHAVPDDPQRRRAAAVQDGEDDPRQVYGPED
jgi:hypothetical protein